MLRDGLWDVTPHWFRKVFLAEPPARQLRFGEGKRRGIITKPSSILGQAGTVTSRAKTVDVILPPELLLRRTIPTPPSAVVTHNDIAALDLVRRTPFLPKDVYWVLGNESTAKTTELVQWIAKKTDITHYQTMLKSHGYKVRRFLIADGKTHTTIADFTSNIAPRAHLWRRMNAILCIAIIGFCVSIWLQPARQAQTEVRQDAVVLERLRNEALDLRVEIEALNQIDTERTAFVNAVMRRTRVVDAIRQLTVALPDSVWISDLLFTSNRITLNGETAQSAADLVLELTDSNLAYVPALTGPVSRTSEGKERFGIVFSATGAGQ